MHLQGGCEYLIWVVMLSVLRDAVCEVASRKVY